MPINAINTWYRMGKGIVFECKSIVLFRQYTDTAGINNEMIETIMLFPFILSKIECTVVPKILPIP